MKRVLSITVAFLAVFAATAARAGVTPAVVQASIRLTHGCSGTVVWIGEEYAFAFSDWHCVNEPGSTVEFNTVTGGGGTARVVDVRKEHDLALLKLWARDCVAECPPAEIIPPDGTWIACGYPGRVGPKFKRLEYVGPARIPQDARTMIERLEFKNVSFRDPGGRVQKGPFYGGDSGGGIAVDDRFVSTISHGSLEDPDVLYGAQYRQVRQMLVENADVFQKYGCDEWWCRPNVPVEPPDPDTYITADAAEDLRREFRQELDGLKQLLRERRQQEEQEPRVDREKILRSVSETVQSILEAREAARRQEELRRENERLRQLIEGRRGYPDNVRRSPVAKEPAPGIDDSPFRDRAEQFLGDVEYLYERRRRQDEILEQLQRTLEERGTDVPLYRGSPK